MDRSEEVSRGFVVAGGDRSELFEFAEEIFDQAARLVKFPVVISAFFAIALWRNDRLLSGGQKRLDHSLVGIVSLVGQHRISVEHRQKLIGAVKVMRLSRREKKAGGIAESVDGGVDFRAQSAFAASDCLLFTAFFCAPALC